MNDLKILKKHVEKLKLDQKSGITVQDKILLEASLQKDRQIDLFNYIKALSCPQELEDLIVNVIYG